MPRLAILHSDCTEAIRSHFPCRSQLMFYRALVAAHGRCHAVVSSVQSSLVKIDLDAGKVVQRWDDIGTKAHAIVAWRDAFLVLDSEAAALVSVNPRDGNVKRLYKARRACRRPHCTASCAEGHQGWLHSICDIVRLE